MFCLSICLPMDTGLLPIFDYMAIDRAHWDTLNSLGHMYRRGIAGSYHNSIFNFSRNRHPIFHSSSTMLHTHQQCTRASLSILIIFWVLFLQLFLLLIVDILKDVRWLNWPSFEILARDWSVLLKQPNKFTLSILPLLGFSHSRLYHLSSLPYHPRARSQTTKDRHYAPEPAEIIQTSQ